MLSSHLYGDHGNPFYRSRRGWNVYNSSLAPIPENRPILYLDPLVQAAEEPPPTEHGHPFDDISTNSQQAFPLCYLVVTAWPVIGSEFFSWF